MVTAAAERKTVICGLPRGELLNETLLTSLAQLALTSDAGGSTITLDHTRNLDGEPLPSLHHFPSAPRWRRSTACLPQGFAPPLDLP